MSGRIPSPGHVVLLFYVCLALLPLLVRALTFAELQALQASLAKSPQRMNPNVISAIYNSNMFVDDHLKPFLGGGEDYRAFVQGQPILATGMFLRQGGMGNHLGNYFELMGCAKLAGLHYIAFPDDETKKEPFFDAVPTAILHPNPAANYSEGIDNAKKHCWPSHAFPWQNSYGDWMHAIDSISDIMSNTISSYLLHTYTTDPAKRVIPLDSFDIVDHKTALRMRSSGSGISGINTTSPTTPLVPDASILVRCTDILDHAAWMSPYGLLNFNTYPMVIPSTSQTIYVVTEPKGYGMLGTVCNEILAALVEYLEKIYPQATIAMRRGHPFDSLAMLSYSPVTVCAPSTFCLWPAIASAKENAKEDKYQKKSFKYLYSSWLFANTRPVYVANNFHWLNFPKYHQFGDDYTKGQLNGGLCCGEKGGGNQSTYDATCCDASVKAIAAELVRDLKTIRPPGPRILSNDSSSSIDVSKAPSTVVSHGAPLQTSTLPVPAAAPVALVAAAAPTTHAAAPWARDQLSPSSVFSPALPHCNASSSKYVMTNGICPFTTVGLEYEADKVGPITRVGSAGHRYGPMYCDILTPLRSSPRKLRVLEIGFGCGHYNNGVGARVIKNFFQSDGGPDVLLWDIDYVEIGIDERGIRQCMDKFNKEYPGVVEDVFFGDQSNVTFLEQVVRATGGHYDVVIDDGGHQLHLIMPSMEYLWPHVAPGGWYIIEDLQPGLHHVIRLTAGWMEELACGDKGGACNRNSPDKDASGYRSLKPLDMREVRCSAEICAYRKAFFEPNATAAASHRGRRRMRSRYSAYSAAD